MICIRDARFPQRFFRKIEPAHRGIFIDVAQNIRQLQRPAEMMRELDALRLAPCRKCGQTSLPTAEAARSQ